MRDELLEAARRQVATTDSGIRAAALLRIARVECVVENAPARRTLQQALDEIRQRPKDFAYLRNEAREVVAAVAPELLLEMPDIPTDRHGEIHTRFAEQSVVLAMLAHGHLDAAFTHLLRSEDDVSFPFGILPNVLHKANTPTPENVARRRALLLKAGAIWRTAPLNRRGRLGCQRFVHAFGEFWRDLPADEARTLVHQIVNTSLSQADQSLDLKFDDKVQFTSAQQYGLFEVIHAVQALDPGLAHSLCQTNGELKAAMHRFPNGMETLRQEALAARAQRKVAGASGEAGCITFGGDPALINAMRNGDFEQAVNQALENLRQDTDPPTQNLAPKEYWPSTGEFRTILYRAGKRLGPEAAKFLVRIPDPDVRLFAMIELAAALAGAPETSRHQISQRNPESQLMRSPDGRLVRCPQCSVTPLAASLWTCECRHHWNTFSTAGRCPSCGLQWRETQCSSCHKWSQHQAWYVTETSSNC